TLPRASRRRIRNSASQEPISSQANVPVTTARREVRSSTATSTATGVTAAKKRGASPFVSAVHPAASSLAYAPASPRKRAALQANSPLFHRAPRRRSSAARVGLGFSMNRFTLRALPDGLPGTMYPYAVSFRVGLTPTVTSTSCSTAIPRAWVAAARNARSSPTAQSACSDSICPPGSCLAIQCAAHASAGAVEAARGSAKMLACGTSGTVAPTRSTNDGLVRIRMRSGGTSPCRRDTACASNGRSPVSGNSCLGRSGVVGGQVAQEVQPGAVGEMQIQQQSIGRRRRAQRTARFVERLRDAHAVAELLEERAEDKPDMWLVIDDKEMPRGAGGGSHGPAVRLQQTSYGGAVSAKIEQQGAYVRCRLHQHDEERIGVEDCDDRESLAELEDGGSKIAASARITELRHVRDG